MKKILLQIFILPFLFLLSCSDDGGGSSTITINKDQKNQTAYADDTEKAIHFTATDTWYTQVDYTTTKATESEEQWVSLDPPSGAAGEVAIKVVLSTNYSGADRKATIQIVCGETTITVTIEQKGKTEEGEVPDEDIPVVGQRKVKKIISYDDREPDHVVFTYDEQGRIKEYSLYKEIAGQKKTEYVATLTYSNDQIIRNFTAYNDGYTSGINTYKLSDNRIYSGHWSQEDFDSDIWHYDSEGNMTKYIEKYKTTQGSIDQDGNEGPTQEVIDSTTTTYTWQNGIIKTMHYYPNSSNSNEVITSEFEYYDLSEIRPLPCVIKLQCSTEELSEEDMTLFGFTGNVPAQFIKKVTTSGDRWDKDNGTSTYRYVTDAQGYVTQIYCKWEAVKDKTDEKEYLMYEISYE